MTDRKRVVPFLLLLLAGPAAGQSNVVPLNNGGDALQLYSDPSAGFPPGSVPPDAAGDLFWKVLPGDRVLNHVTAGGQTMEIDGYIGALFDTDWTTSPDFYDRTHGSALPAFNGALEPAFFQLGFTGETVVTLGNSGFGNPCTVSPSLCTPPGGNCPPSGFINGYVTLVTIGSPGVIVPADGTPASDLATTYFVPGGMTTVGGTCGLGDYVVQDLHSIDETQVGLPGGENPYGGLQLAGSGPLPEPASSTATASLTFRERVLSAVADSGTGLGIEAGGAMNGLSLPAGGGASTFGAQLRASRDTGVPNVALAASSLGVVPTPGFAVFGASQLLIPDAVFALTSKVWVGAIGSGTFHAVQLPVPAGAVGLDLHTQGFVLHTGTLQGFNTNVVCTSLAP